MLNNQITVLGGYEAGAPSALNELIPGIVQRGSWFQYIQLILRKWIRLELIEVPRDILWMSMSLALIPANSFAEGLALIEAVADIVANEHPRVLEFLLHVRQQWSPRAGIICAYNCSIRKNDDIEALNMNLKQRFAGSTRNGFMLLGNN